MTGQILGARGSASEAVLCGGGGRRAYIYQRRAGRHHHQGTETPVKPGNKKMIKSHLVSRSRCRRRQARAHICHGETDVAAPPSHPPPPPPSYSITGSFITPLTTTLPHKADIFSYRGLSRTPPSLQNYTHAHIHLHILLFVI